MKRYSTIAASVLLVFTSVQLHAQDKHLFDAGTTPTLVSNQFSVTEGASVDKKGNIFFTDQPNDKIWEYDTDGKLSVFLDKTDRSNGMYFDNKGNLVTSADELGEI